MYSYPFYAIDFRQLAEKFSQSAALVQIQSIIGRVLGDQDQFLDSISRQRLGLGHKTLHRNGSVRSPDERNGTVGAPSVTALGDFQVRIGAVIRPESRRIFGRHAPQSLDNRIQVSRPEPEIHFRNQFRHLGHVSLRKTSENHQSSYLARLLALGGGEDGLDGLLLRVADESAGVDEKHIDRTDLILRHNPPRVLDLRKKMFRVNRVLGTA